MNIEFYLAVFFVDFVLFYFLKKCNTRRRKIRKIRKKERKKKYRTKGLHKLEVKSIFLILTEPWSTRINSVPSGLTSTSVMNAQRLVSPIGEPIKLFWFSPAMMPKSMKRRNPKLENGKWGK